MANAAGADGRGAGEGQALALAHGDGSWPPLGSRLTLGVAVHVVEHALAGHEQGLALKRRRYTHTEFASQMTFTIYRINMIGDDLMPLMLSHVLFCVRSV